MHFLFFAISVWGPLLLLGYFRWDAPPRYAQGQLGVFLLCTFAGIAYLLRERMDVSDDSKISRPLVVMLAVVSVAIINPIALGRTVNPNYGLYPDHKGAAEFILDLHLKADAVLIAEDVLQQTYYLGRVDYWLRPIQKSNRYSVIRDGRLVDMYTATPTLGTGAELQAVLDLRRGRETYVIGSGENFVDGKSGLRNQNISKVLESDRLKVVYEGRDGKTTIWKLVR